MRRLAPYAIAVGGVVGITAAIGLITSRAPVQGLSALYLLLVLWLAARWGRWPAVVGSVEAFLLYDFFLVPPVGTFAVRGTAELLELVVLLAVALVTSQLASSLRRTRATAEALARESRALYELATEALRSQEVTVALSMLCGRATELRCVDRFALVAVDYGLPSALAGSELNAAELKQAAWSHENGRSIGIAVRGGAVSLMRTHPGARETAYLPLASGVAVMGIDGDLAGPDELRMLAALIGLADLLLDRRRRVRVGTSARPRIFGPAEDGDSLLGRRSVTVAGKSVRLSPTEYELLRFLALHAGKPVTHTMLLRQVWGEYAIGDTYNTRYVVAQIRKKLGDDPANPRYIVNEPGVGYRLEG